MKNTKLTLLLLALFTCAVGAKSVNVTVYYGSTCPHCLNFDKLLEKVSGDYELNIQRFEVWDNAANRERMARDYEKFGYSPEEGAVPTVILGGRTFIVGEIPEAQLRGLLDSCTETECQRVDVGISKTPSLLDAILRALGLSTLNPVSVFLAGIIAGFNPCLFAVLLFLVSYSLAVSKSKARLIMTAMFFALGIFATYLVVGFGLLSASSYIDVKLLNYIIAAFVIIIGAWYIKDYNNPQSKLIETPAGAKKIIESLTYRANFLASFLLGALFSLVKAPCVGGIYLYILGNAASSDSAVRTGALQLLAAFNLGLVFPLIILAAIVYLGVPPEKIDKWREENRGAFRLFIGATLILVGVIILEQMGAIRI
ncbi:MAG: cytochrome c biogenesis protein [Candidatus Micrarchaeota archaeon]